MDKRSKSASLSEIERTVKVYLITDAWCKDLPDPKKRKEQLEDAIKNQPDQPDEPDWIKDWIKDLKVSDNRTEVLNALLLSSTLKRGPQKNYAFEYLIATLSDIFSRYTGLERSVTWNDYRGRYGGSLIEFTMACLIPLGKNHTKSRYALAQAFRRIFKNRKKK